MLREQIDIQSYLDSIEGKSGTVPSFPTCLVGAVLQFSMFGLNGLGKVCECGPPGTTQTILRKWIWESTAFPSGAVQARMLQTIAQRLRVLHLQFRAAGLEMPSSSPRPRNPSKIDLDDFENA